MHTPNHTMQRTILPFFHEIHFILRWPQVKLRFAVTSPIGWFYLWSCRGLMCDNDLGFDVMLEAVSLEVFGSCKDIIAEVTTQVLGASDIARTSNVGTESTCNWWDRSLLTPEPLMASECSGVTLDALLHAIRNNLRLEASGTMHYICLY